MACTLRQVCRTRCQVLGKARCLQIAVCSAPECLLPRPSEAGTPRPALQRIRCVPRRIVGSADLASATVQLRLITASQHPRRHYAVAQRLVRSLRHPWRFRWALHGSHTPCIHRVGVVAALPQRPTLLLPPPPAPPPPPLLPTHCQPTANPRTSPLQGGRGPIVRASGAARAPNIRCVRCDRHGAGRGCRGPGGPLHQLHVRYSLWLHMLCAVLCCAMFDAVLCAALCYVLWYAPLRCGVGGPLGCGGGVGEAWVQEHGSLELLLRWLHRRGRSSSSLHVS